MSILKAGDIGRLNETASTLLTDDFVIVRSGVLYRLPSDGMLEGGGVTVVTESQVIDNSSFNWFANTTGAPIILTLPANPSQAESYRLVNASSSLNTLTISPNGAQNLLGENSDFLLSSGESLSITYDENLGWY